MAVIPYARRAWRPAYIPWLLGAAVFIAILLGVSTVLLLHGGGRAASSAALTSEVSSVFVEAPAASAASLTPSESATSREPLLTAQQRAVLSEGTASDVLMAAQEAAYFVERVAPVTDETASIEPIAEAADATVVEAEDAAPAPAEAASSEPVAVSEPEPTTVAPASDTQAPPSAPAPVVAPATFAGPIERWAAAGIYIETAGQDLDDASLANVDTALNTLPPAVLGSLGNPALGPMHILVNKEGRVLSGDQPYGGPANFFSTNEGTNELVLYPNQSVFTIVHELGHAYNLRHIAAGRYAMVLLDGEMRSFLASTGWQILSSDDEIRSAVDHMHVRYSYNSSFHWPRMSNDDPLEDFANSFSMYFLDPAGLNASSPERYAWMAATFGR